jgi:hypothetical protein
MTKAHEAKLNPERPGSPTGRRGPRKAKYNRNLREPWDRADVQALKQLAGQNTPTA